MGLACLLTLGLPSAPRVLVDNGGWCWYQDERAIVVGDAVLFGSVAHRRGPGGAERHGNIELTAWDLGTGFCRTVVLHERLEADDHNVPALLRRPDGRLLAVYTKHSSDALIRWRVTAEPGTIGAWQPEATAERPTRVCYSNLLRLAAENDGRGRLHNFYRGEGFDPNVMISDDDGATWRYGGHLLVNPGDERGRIRPYVKYAGNGTDTLHFVTTEGHPAAEPRTSLYHGFLRGGVIHRSDGTPLRALADGPVDPAELTCVYRGGPHNKAWTIDLHLDAAGRPYTVYSVHHHDLDHRYRYARWDGSRWHDFPLAFAGRRLYRGEDHYTGLAALDPGHPGVVCIATDADPVTGSPLLSAADGQRHWELFWGETGDGGATWRWSALTRDSTEDNLRPVLPADPAGRRPLLWLRGEYTRYTDYRLQAVGVVLRPAGGSEP